MLLSLSLSSVLWVVATGLAAGEVLECLLYAWSYRPAATARSDTHAGRREPGISLVRAVSMRRRWNSVFLQYWCYTVVVVENVRQKATHGEHMTNVAHYTAREDGHAPQHDESSSTPAGEILLMMFCVCFFAVRLKQASMFRKKTDGIENRVAASGRVIYQCAIEALGSIVVGSSQPGRC